MKTAFFTFFLLISVCGSYLTAQNLEDFKQVPAPDIMENTIHNEFRFNGYTNYWHDIYREWFRYGNLFKMANASVPLTIAQSKRDIADDMGIPGLIMQEGFMAALLAAPHDVLDQPAVQELESIGRKNVLAYLDPASEPGKILMSKYREDPAGLDQIQSHQIFAEILRRLKCFISKMETGRSLWLPLQMAKS
jgi:hypothetical protein